MVEKPYFTKIQTYLNDKVELTSISNDKMKTARIRITTKGENILEIINNKTSTVYSVNLTSKRLHDVVCVDSKFSSLSWSLNDNFICYVANKFQDYNVGIKKSYEIDKFLYHESYGECLDTVHDTIVVIFDTITKDLKLIVNENFYLAKPSWISNNSLMVMAYLKKPFKQGLIYCMDFKCYPFLYENVIVNSNYVDLFMGKFVNDTISMYQIDSDGKYALMCINECNKAHMCSTTLYLYSFTDQVYLPLINGIYLVNMVSSMIDIRNDNILIFYTIFSFKNNKKDILYFNKNKGSSTNLTDLIEGSFDLLLKIDYGNNPLREKKIIIIAKYSTQHCFNKLVYCIVDVYEENLFSKNWAYLDDDNPIITDNLTSVHYHDSSRKIIIDSDRACFNSMITFPKCINTQKWPVILIVHGGPHSVIVNEFSRLIGCWLSTNYAVVCVNYRGSLGKDDTTLYSLHGHVGDVDVKDCHEAFINVLNYHSDYLDLTRLYISGGSHGGFIGLKLLSNYPGSYNAASLRNPVVDFLSSFYTTDIPRWVEQVLNIKMNKQNILDNFDKIFKCSALFDIDKIITPLLLLSGDKDLRVDKSQSSIIYRRLKNKLFDFRFIVYPNAGHSFEEIEYDLDQMINTLLWFENHRYKLISIE